MVNTAWDADLYLKFQKERTQPSIDLVNRIDLDDPKRIVDVGCGPGNSTAILRNRWNAAKIIGVDSSEQMIKKAQKSFPGGSWILSDALSFDQTEKFDIVFSNAVIQWIPEHEVLLPHMISLLKPKGTLAIQVPQNQDSPLHRALFETASEIDFRQHTKEAKHELYYKTGQYYYNLLSDRIKDLYIWETIYYHILESHEDLITWYKSTGMRPFLEKLPNEDLKSRMINSILKKCIERYRKQSDSKIIFPFKRLFLLGYNY